MENLIKKRVAKSSAESADSSAPVQEAKKAKRRPRCGQGCKKRKQQKKEKDYLNAVRKIRNVETRQRNDEMGRASSGPFIGSEAAAKSHCYNVSSETTSFYVSQVYGNDMLDVLECANVSNPEGLPGKGKGVFAAKFIAARTCLCPYVGVVQKRPCPEELHCQYDLRLADNLFYCARDKLYDIGYLAASSNVPGQNPMSHVKEDGRCPPNYGRYFNTGMSENDNNCVFEIAGDGFDAIFLYSARDIKKGEELLVSYGDQFKIQVGDRDVSDDDNRTVCDSDDDFEL
jgi:hypothetical protein